MQQLQPSSASSGKGLSSTLPAESLIELGLASSLGRGQAPDLASAHKWFNLAAMKGSAEAALHRQEIAQEMLAEQVAAALRAAREWLATN